MATVTYKVKKGDTLSEIAVKYGTTVTNLAKLNDILNPNLIYVDQELVISGKSSLTKKFQQGSSNKATVIHFGLQSNTTSTIFATWAWTKSYTENYRVIWYYDTGDGVWFVGNDSTVNIKQSTYSAPSNATRVKFKVKPIAKKKKVNNKETDRWTAKWSTEKIYKMSSNPPTSPGKPEVSINKYTLTARLDGLNKSTLNATHVQFRIIKDDSTKGYITSPNLAIVTGTVSWDKKIELGKSYKVKARTYNSKNKEYSADWGDIQEYGGPVETMPPAPSGITACKGNSKTSVYLEWSAVKNAKTYTIEYATDKNYFDNTDKTTEKGGITFTHHEVTDLESGKEYFFRVKAVNDAGESTWTKIKSVVIGTTPAAPTTWSSTTTAIVGEPLNLYWVHNSEDGSSQTKALLELTVDGVTETIEVPNTTDEDKKDDTSVYPINTSQYIEGTTIKWRVKTAGITGEYGGDEAWSIQRTIDIYAPASLDLIVTDSEGYQFNALESFPIYIVGEAYPKSQTPIGYHITVTANESYTTVDQIGNTQTISAGSVIYSKYFDVSTDLAIELSANNIDLENNISYTITGVVSMDSGLTSEPTTADFVVSWTDAIYEPNAEIVFNPETLDASIRPYLRHTVWKYYKVNYNSTTGTYINTKEVIDELEGESVDEAYTTDGDIVYSGTTSTGISTYFCMKESEEEIYEEGVLLSVYRREYDGTFVELATGIDNASSRYVPDPHPALDYARYRIVAITESTGAVSYYDVPGYPTGEKAAIIQWDEEWSYFDVTEESELEQQPWSGSLLKLPYNIDVSDKHNSDVSHVKYIGRKHPVSYYGTQVGETSTWNVDIKKSDEETLYALRRLSKWMSDVYVREPSGSGYWASVSVSFSQKHCELTIPVTLEITRVEGGI